jgi:hypothetical protein
MFPDARPSAGPRVPYMKRSAKPTDALLESPNVIPSNIPCDYEMTGDI